MTDERYKAVFDDDAKLTQDEINLGWHFCWEWDQLLVGPGMGELEVCGCLEKDHPVYKTIPPESKQPLDVTDLL